MILKEGLAALDTVADLVELEQVKARYLGKSGALTELLKQLGKLSPDAGTHYRPVRQHGL